MKGPEHYAEAERLLKSTTRCYNGGQTVREEPPSEAAVARAQVHATLALVAATVAERVTAPANSPDVLVSDVTEDWGVTR